jgi:ABC-type sugar transport system ATPase subunit
MNLLTGALDRENGGWRFKGQNVDVQLAPQQMGITEAALTDAARDVVRLGVRPEHLRLAPAGDSGIPGRVKVLEPVGSDLFVAVEAGGTIMQVRTDPESPVTEGDTLTLVFDPSRGHLFGADGSNLRHAPTSVSAPPEPTAV